METSIIFLILLLTTSITLCQETNKSNAEFNFGIGLSRSDVRPTDRYTPLNKPLFDYDIFLNYNRRLIEKGNLEFYAGVGYLLNINMVRLPLNNAHFNENREPFLINRTYLKSNIHLPVEFRYSLGDSKLSRFSFTLGIINNLVVHKFARSTSNWNLSAIKIEPSETELHTGIRYEKGNVGYYLQYRLLNQQYKDNALSNSGKDLDYYNPVKFRIGLSKMLK